MALSNAEMQVSKEEASVGRFEAFWAKITMVLLLGLAAYGIWIVIVTERED